jgi:uncharacterized protein (TIGR04255 family)
LARSLPDYKSPPVVEVAISVFFKPLQKFSSAHYGAFWKELGDHFPEVEDNPPVFGGRTPQIFEAPPLPRVFFKSVEGEYLLQLQPDLFVQNWRKTKLNQQYAHFETIAAEFESRWNQFRSYASRNQLGNLECTRFEMVYVNQVFEPKGTFPMALERFTDLVQFRQRKADHFLPDPSSFSAEIQFNIPENSGVLSVSFKHGTRSDEKDVLQIDLTARKQASPEGTELKSWLNVAHTWIVRGFTDLTSETAHKQWERIQ